MASLLRPHGHPGDTAGWIGRQEWRAVRLRRNAQTVAIAVEEAYLRADISCGAEACPVCAHTVPNISAAAKHIVVPDAAAVVSLLEVWVLPELTNFVLLSSVLRQVADSSSMYRKTRVQSLYRDTRRHCSLFDNLHFAPTAPRLRKRAGQVDIVRACEWLAEHLGLQVVVLSDEVALRFGASTSEHLPAESHAGCHTTKSLDSSRQPSNCHSLSTAHQARAAPQIVDSLAVQKNLHSLMTAQNTATMPITQREAFSRTGEVNDDDFLDTLLAEAPESVSLPSRPVQTATNGKAAGLCLLEQSGLEDGDDFLDDLLNDQLPRAQSMAVPKQPVSIRALQSRAAAAAAVPAAQAKDMCGDQLLDDLLGSDFFTDAADCNGPWDHPHMHKATVKSAALEEKCTRKGCASESVTTVTASGQCPPAVSEQQGFALRGGSDSNDDLLDVLMAEDAVFDKAQQEQQQPDPQSDAVFPSLHRGVQLSQGVTAMTRSQYFQAYWSHCPLVTELSETLIAADEESQWARAAAGISGGVAPYSAHLSPAATDSGLASGSLLQGRIGMGRQGPWQAVVKVGVGATAFMITVAGEQHVNRALHGDTVAIRLLPKDQWQAADFEAIQEGRDSQEDWSVLTATDAAQDETKMSEEGGPPAIPSTVAAAVSTTIDQTPVAGLVRTNFRRTRCTSAPGWSRPTGEVVAVLHRRTVDVVACISERDEAALADRGASDQQELVMCIPMDRRLPRLRLRTRRGSALLGQRFLARVDGWLQSSRLPVAHLVRTLGALGDLQAEKEAILIGAGVVRRPWAPACKAELPREGPWQPTATDLATRRDLRGSNQLLVSIDPPNCTDVDDVLSARQLPNGDIEIGVHIADVSAFVPQGGALDAEAAARGTSVYLADERIDMLPAELSADKCSLLADCDRPAVSVVWTCAAGDLSVVNLWLGRTVIRSRHQLSYQQAQNVADRRDDEHGGDSLSAAAAATLEQMMDLLLRVTNHWRSQRQQAGALKLEGSELHFETSADGRSQDVVRKQELPVMAMVAEAMIAANCAVAHRIQSAFPQAALLRRHAPPHPEAFAELAEVMKEAGISLDASTGVALARSLAAIAAARPGSSGLVGALATRAMSEAEYFSTGDAMRDLHGTGHFGLAVKQYTHFTSPIRRYADLVVHRQLLQALKSNPTAPSPSKPGATKGPCEGNTLQPPLQHAQLASTASQLNEATRGAKMAQRDCSNLFLLLLLHKQPHVEEAVVFAVKGSAAHVFVGQYHIRGVVHLADRDGVPLPPPQSQGAEAEDCGSPCALLKRQRLVVEEGDSRVRIIDPCDPGNEPVVELKTGHRVWLRLSADATRAHSPSLKLRLLADCHPDACTAAAAAAASAPAPRSTGASASRLSKGAVRRKQVASKALLIKRPDAAKWSDESVSTGPIRSTSPTASHSADTAFNGSRGAARGTASTSDVTVPAIIGSSGGERQRTGITLQPDNAVAAAACISDAIARALTEATRSANSAASSGEAPREVRDSQPRLLETTWLATSPPIVTAMVSPTVASQARYSHVTAVLSRYPPVAYVTKHARSSKREALLQEHLRLCARHKLEASPIC